MNYAKNRSDAFSDKVQFIADKLRLIADEVEREASVKVDISTMVPDHARSASEVVHKVAWGVANLHLDGLIMAAAEADRAPQVQAEVESKS